MVNEQELSVRGLRLAFDVFTVEPEFTVLDIVIPKYKYIHLYVSKQFFGEITAKKLNVLLENVNPFSSFKKIVLAQRSLRNIK